MHDSDPLSEGARRVLSAAVELARAQRRVRVEAAHLLHALWADQSRAAELLEAAGMSEDGWLTRLPRDAEREAAPAEPTEPDQSVLHLIVRAARDFVPKAGRHNETGTEHLLAGLLHVDAACAERLSECGVDVEALRTSFPSRTAVAEAIDVDVRLRILAPAASQAADADRILDAAANRCREGLRVVEDYVRFALNDAHLSQQLKDLRHLLAAALERLGGERMVRGRDTAHDVGTSIHTPSEALRDSAEGVVQANCKRVEEALRTLEEFGKLVSPKAAAEIGALRYRFYTLEKAIANTALSRERLANCRLYLLVTDRLCPRGLGPSVRAALQGGVDAVQLREKDVPDRRLIGLAKYVREWTREADALFIVNDRPDLAALVDADGVHVGQDDLPVHEARRIVGSGRLVGVSTHSIEQARQAVLDGADYLGVGPVFPSGTKAFERLAGLEFVRQAAAEITLPWFAIGGITVENVGEVIETGAQRVAVSGTICAAEDAQAAARRLRTAL
jgi:thiamine-phosphate pyrophosphorylase